MTDRSKAGVFTGGSNDMNLATRSNLALAEDIPTNSYRRHVSIRLKISCGCTAQFGTLDDAEAHAMKTGHTLTIAGEVRST